MAATAQEKLAPVKHIIVIYLENHSFDNLFGMFPGADGIANAGDKALQTDASGKPYTTLPPVMVGHTQDARFPSLPNTPFAIAKYVKPEDKTGDLVHRFYQLQEQMDGGKMDKFALISNAGGLVMGYYDQPSSPLWKYAERYTLADHFFTAAFGGSLLNHFWLICACTPHYDHAPKALLSTLDSNGMLVKDAPLTPDGYAVNTIEPYSQPFETKYSDPAMRLPAVTLPTIGDRLSAKGIGWAWYSGGWDDAIAGKPDPSFVPHHQPFAYFAAYETGTKGRKEHLKDESDFIAAIAHNTLPAVVFYKPLGKVDMHPGYSAVTPSETHVFSLIDSIEKSPAGKDSIIIVTFDDAGGWWDHVMPAKADRFGPGERVPTVIISPYAKRGFIDHTPYDTTAILKLIETRFDLKPLSARDANAADLTNALQ
jgi:phospholipase C